IALHAHVAAERLERPDPRVTDRMKESLERILTATKRLDRMVGDLSDVSRIEASHLKLDLRPVDLAQIVDDLVARMAPLTAGRPLRREERGVSRHVTVDPGRMEQVLDNLLSNALKYGDRGTEIGLDVEWTSDQVKIAITNQGAGIASEDLARVFERF